MKMGINTARLKVQEAPQKLWSYLAIWEFLRDLLTFALFKNVNNTRQWVFFTFLKLYE